MKALINNAEFISKTFEQEESEGNFIRVSPSVSGVILPELSFDPENSTNTRIIFTEQVYEGDTISCVYGSEITEIKLSSIIVDGDNYIAYVGLVNQVEAPSKIYSGKVPRTTVFSGNTRNSTVTEPIEAEVVDSTTSTATIRITNKGEQTLDSNSIVVLDNEETVATISGMVESEVVNSGKDILQPLGLPTTSIFSNPTAATVDSNGGSRFFLGGYVYTQTNKTSLRVYFLNRPFDTRSISESYTFNYSAIIGFNNSTTELVVGGGFSPNGKHFYAIFHGGTNTSIKVGTLVLNEPFYLNKGFTKHEHPKLSIAVTRPTEAGSVYEPSIHVAPDCSRAYLLFTVRTSTTSPYYPNTTTYELEINTADYLFDDTVTPYRLDNDNYQQFKGVGFCGVSQELVISISNTNHTNNNTPTYVVTTIGVKGLTNYSLKSINAKISTLYTKRDLHSVISEEIVSEASAAHTYFRIFGETKEGQVVLNSTNSVEGLYKYVPVNKNKDFSISFSSKSTAPTSCMILPKTSSLSVTYDVGGSKTLPTISSTLFNSEIMTADTLEAGQTCLFNRHARSVVPTLLGNPKYVLEEKLREYVINGEVETVYGSTDTKVPVNIFGLTPINAEGTKFIGGYSSSLFWFEVEKAYDFSTIKNITNDNLITHNSKYFGGVTTITNSSYASFIVSPDYLKIEVLSSSRQIGTINLTTPADFSTAKWTTFSSSTSISSALVAATGFQLSADGTKAYAYRGNITASDGTTIKGVQEYTLSTPFNLMSMAVSDKALYDLPAYRVSTNNYFKTFCWNSDGTVGLAIFRNHTRSNQLDVVVFEAITAFDLDSLNEIQRIETLQTEAHSLLNSLRVREDGVEEFIFTVTGNAGYATVLELAPFNHYKLDHDELPELPSYCTIVKEGVVVKPQFASEGAEGLVITYPEHSLEPNTRALALKTVANKKATIGSINCEIWRAN